MRYALTMTFELSWKCIKEYEIDFEQQRGELQSLRSGQSTALIEVDRLKLVPSDDLLNVITQISILRPFRHFL